MASVEAWATVVMCIEKMGGMSGLWHTGNFKCGKIFFNPEILIFYHSM